MGTERLIGRSFWGFVCSEGRFGRGRTVWLHGQSVGVWRWVMPVISGLRWSIRKDERLCSVEVIHSTSWVRIFLLFSRQKLVSLSMFMCFPQVPPWIH